MKGSTYFLEEICVLRETFLRGLWLCVAVLRRLVLDKYFARACLHFVFVGLG